MNQEQIKQFRLRARQKGFSEAQINAEIARKQQEVVRQQAATAKPNVQQPAPAIQPVAKKKSVGGFVQNVGTDIVENVKGLANLPGALWSQAQQNVETMRNPNESIGKRLYASTPLAMAEPFVKGIVSEYGDLLQHPIEHTYEHPVSTVLDVLPFLTKGKAPKATKLLEETGTKVTQAGEQLALKSLRPSPSQLTQFKKATGVDMAKFMAERNIVGDYVNYSKNAIDTLQNAFDGIAVKSGTKISKSQISNSFKPIINELKNSKLSANKAKALTLKKEVKGILQGIDDTNDVSVITEIRRSADDLAKKFSQDPANADLYQLVRDGLQDVVRERTKALTVDVPGGKIMNLKQLGEEIHKFREFEKIASKQENLGRGAKPIGLIKSVMTGGGGATAGIPGAVAGFAASTVLESPKVLGTTSKVLQNLGGAIKGKASTIANAGKNATVGSTLLGRQTLNQPQNESNLIEPSSGQTEQTPEISGTEDMVSQKGIAPHPIFGSMSKKQVLEKAFKSGMNNKQLDEVEQIYDRFAPEGENNVKLSDAAIKSITDIRGALRDVDNLRTEIKGSDLVGPIKGLNAKNPYATGSRELQAVIDRVRQNVGKALEGGVLRKEDEEKYKRILPTITDTKEVALDKLDQLEKTMKSNVEDYIYMQKMYGKGSEGTTANDLLGL